MKSIPMFLFLIGCALLSGCSEDADQIPDFDPKASNSKDGYGTSPKAFIDKDMKVYWSQQAVTKRSKANYGDMPRKAIIKKANQRCRFSKNLPGELIRSVFIGRPRFSKNYGETVPIFSHSQAVIRKNVKDWLKSYKKQGKAPKPQKTMYYGTSMDVMDVMVTDTSGPIRLVLQAGS